MTKTSSRASPESATARPTTSWNLDPDAGDHLTYSVSDSRFEVVDGNLKLKDGVSLDFETEPIGVADGLIIVAAGVVLMVVLEVEKALLRRYPIFDGLTPAAHHQPELSKRA